MLHAWCSNCGMRIKRKSKGVAARLRDNYFCSTKCFTKAKQYSKDFRRAEKEFSPDEFAGYFEKYKEPWGQLK
jgi:hypothetical protein